MHSCMCLYVDPLIYLHPFQQQLDTAFVAFQHGNSHGNSSPHPPVSGEHFAMDMNAPPPPSTPKRARASATPADWQEAGKKKLILHHLWTL